jgi:ATP-dependent helicase/nuclease subunit A
VIQGAAEGPDNGWTTRPAGYGDCAVLLQSRTRLKEYEAALRRKGIPYRVLGGIGFYEEDEIQAMMNVLFFLWNRRDRLSLAAALKSPLFGLSDQDVLDLFTAAEDAGSVLRTKWPAASEMLNTWGRMAGVEPLTGLIRRIIRDTGAYVRFGRENPQAIFNLDKFLDTSREFDRRGYTTLQDFVELVQNIRASEQREATADLNLPGFEGAVNIMTVHKAKGLEFPAVFLPGMNQQPRSVSRGPSAIIEADGRVRMSVKDAENPLYAGMWDREQQELRREHQRLLYVAMTRARDHLVMIGALGGGRSPVKQDTWLNWLRRVIPSSAAAEEDAARIVVSSHPEWQATARPFTPAAAAGSGPSERKPPVTVDGNRILENLAPVPASKTPEWKKATDFLSEDKELYLELAPVPLPGNLSPLVRGSLLHRCLEGLTKGGTCDLSQAAREFPEVEALAGEAKTEFLREADAVLRAVTGRKGLEWIFERRPGSYSELPFLLRKGKDIVSGVIDRVVVEEQKAYVVDYKAILIEHDEALKRWCDHYRPQIRIYCEAVREMFRLEDVEGFLLFLDSARLEKVV